MTDFLRRFYEGSNDGEGRARPADASSPSTPPTIKLVAVDLDGTLLNDSKQVSEQTTHALACLTERDVQLVIASARPPRSVRRIYRELGLSTWQINYNGALIWDEPNQRAVFHRPLAGELARQIVEFARDLFEETIVTCEVLDKWYTDRNDMSHTTETGKMFQPDFICPVAEICDGPITKLMLLGEPRVMLRLENELALRFTDQVTILRSDRDLIQIMHREVSKAVALARIAQHHGIPMSQVMAIGDAPNDVGMLQAAGVSVAMDNAHELVKEIADWVAPSNNDHGVHAALTRYGLCS